MAIDVKTHPHLRVLPIAGIKTASAAVEIRACWFHPAINALAPVPLP